MNKRNDEEQRVVDFITFLFSFIFYVASLYIGYKKTLYATWDEVSKYLIKKG